MKMTSPLYSLKGWKKLGSVATSQMYHVEGSGVFRRESSYVQLCRHYTTTNPRTSFQQSGRSMFAIAVSGWHGLSPSEKDEWDFYQDHRRRKPVMSGYNLYISRFLLSGGDPKIPPGG